MSLTQRIRDFIRERRLDLLRSQYLAALDAKEYEFAAELWEDFKAEHAKRSPEQVARMERKMGIRA